MPEVVTCVDLAGRHHTVSVEQLVWRPAAYAIVIKDGKLLVSPRRKGYDLPGGGVEFGETPEAAVIRETKEETGIVVANPRLVAADTVFFTFDASEEKYQCLMLYYLCDFADGELSADGFDEWELQHSFMPEWHPLSELDTMIPASSVDFRKYVQQVLTTFPLPKH